MNDQYNVNVDSGEVVVTVPSTKVQVHELDTVDVFERLLDHDEAIRSVNNVVVAAADLGIDALDALALIGESAKQGHPNYEPLGLVAEDDPYHVALLILDSLLVRFLDLCESAYLRIVFYEEQGVDITTVIPAPVVAAVVDSINEAKESGLKDSLVQRLLEGTLVLS